METRRRSIAKAISYRVLGSLTTAGIAFVMTGSVATSLGVGGFDAIAKMFAYYVHERAWSRISYGKAKPPEYVI